MREILFRGQRLDNSNWVYGVPLVFEDIELFAIQTLDDGAIFRVVPDSIGQYVGCTDINDRKIFEGDIVLVSSFGYIPLKFNGVVIFDNCCFGVSYDYYGPRFHRIGSLDEWQDMGASGTITYSYEVVGNVYDNPDIPLTVIKE